MFFGRRGESFRRRDPYICRRADFIVPASTFSSPASSSCSPASCFSSGATCPSAAASSTHEGVRTSVGRTPSLRSGESPRTHGAGVRPTGAGLRRHSHPFCRCPGAARRGARGNSAPRREGDRRARLHRRADAPSHPRARRSRSQANSRRRVVSKDFRTERKIRRCRYHASRIASSPVEGDREGVRRDFGGTLGALRDLIGGDR
jgi:hypothetical protein